MNITSAIINTATGVTKTLAEWGWPLGAIFAAIVGAMGAAQIAMIASTPITTGAEEGGQVIERMQDGKKFNARYSPDKRGFISSPTVLVSENGKEYVVPAAAMDNPSLIPVLNTIEAARRQGTLGSFDCRIPAKYTGTRIRIRWPNRRYPVIRHNRHGAFLFGRRHGRQIHRGRRSSMRRAEESDSCLRDNAGRERNRCENERVQPHAGTWANWR